MTYRPDYRIIADAAWNRHTAYIPLYEHNVCYGFFDQATDTASSSLLSGDLSDKKEFFRRYTDFLISAGYDVVPLEAGVVELVQQGMGLMGQAGAIISSHEDLQKFPWDEMPQRFFHQFSDYYEALAQVMPDGMKAAGGVGFGVFEVTQDFVPFTDLSYLSIDDPELFAALFSKVGDMLAGIWTRLLNEYGDMFALCRSGDDLGFKTSTLLSPETIRRHIIPQYKRIADIIHRFSKPFLLHSCGAIFPVMEDIIDAGIDAKHSNEDSIAPFSEWVSRYGDRIGNFGGFDMNVICLEDEQTIRAYVTEVLNSCSGKPGIAVGTGNQIADYVPPENFFAMINTVREFRGT